jgi:hypothetical protein
MASSFIFSQSHTTTPTVEDNNYVNLLSANVASGSDLTTAPAANPITIPGAGSSYSYERYLRGHWTGTFSTITSIYFWKSAGTPGTGWTINAGNKANQTYATPVATASTIATAAIPTTQGTGLTPTYAAAFCDYIVLQAVLGTTCTPGALATLTYTFQWNET